MGLGGEVNTIARVKIAGVGMRLLVFLVLLDSPEQLLQGLAFSGGLSASQQSLHPVPQPSRPGRRVL